MSDSNQHVNNTTGIQLPAGACVVLVRTEWNAETVGKLEAGCIKILQEHKVNYQLITVPGAFEIPFAIKKYWEDSKYKENKPCAFIALGCVLGVLTVDNQQQADDRTGGKHGNKGEESAISALKMMALVATFK